MECINRTCDRNRHIEQFEKGGGISMSLVENGPGIEGLANDAWESGVEFLNEEGDKTGVLRQLQGIEAARDAESLAGGGDGQPGELADFGWLVIEGTACREDDPVGTGGELGEPLITEKAPFRSQWLRHSACFRVGLAIEGDDGRI